MVYLSPVGLSAAPVANRLSLLATFKESLCKSVCTASTNQPESFVQYSTGTPILNDTTVFIPVPATVTIVAPGYNCVATTQVITEKFVVAFQDQTAVPTSVTITQEGITQEYSNVRCGKSKCLTINSSIAITIVPATAAA